MSLGDQLEDRIGPQRVVIILVFVAGDDAEDSLPQDTQGGVLRITARILDQVGKGAGPLKFFVELSEGQQTRIGREFLVDLLDLDWSIFPKPEDKLLRRL